MMHQRKSGADAGKFLMHDQRCRSQVMPTSSDDARLPGAINDISSRVMLKQERDAFLFDTQRNTSLRRAVRSR